MATTKLALYNKALRHIGERKLASLAEAREPRRVLDEVWDGEAIRFCLDQGLWRFATRAVSVDYEPAIEPSFGYSRAFTQPSDYVRTAEFASDEYFHSPLTDYSTEAGYWYADLDTVYVKYVSDDAAYGSDYSLWPPTFTEWVGAWLASQVAMRLTSDLEKTDYLRQLQGKMLREAQAQDAMSSPTKVKPNGRWARARGAGWGGDRGSRSQLTG